VVHSEVARHQKHNRKVLPVLLPRFRVPVEAREVYADRTRAMLDHPDVRRVPVVDDARAVEEQGAGRAGRTCRSARGQDSGDAHICVPRFE
jgi:hypothetical protein